MARHVLYIKVEGYIRDWLLWNYGNGHEPVVFPKWSLENDILQDNIKRKPQFWEPVREEGCIAFQVPKREGLNRDAWCYVSSRSLRILRKVIIKHFIKDFMTFLCKPNPNTPTIRLRVLDFMRKNGIQESHSNLETLLQIRIRKKHLYEQPSDIDIKANKAHKGTTKKGKTHRKENL